MTTTAIYPAKSAPALGYLKKKNNDIEVFVEDTANPNIWLKLLKNFLPPSVKLNDVNGLGSKQNVLNACKADQNDDGRRKLYIIDGDMDFLRGKTKPNLKYLYRLRSYCIENYLLQEDAIIDIVMSLNTSISESDVRSKLDYEEWLSKNNDCLRRLFVCYALSEELNLGIETVNYSAYKLLEDSNKSCNFCSKKVFSRTAEIYRKAISTTDKKTRKTLFKNLEQRAAASTMVIYASGKDYIFPILHNRIRSLFQIRQRNDSLRCLLADKVKPSVDPYLHRRMRSL